jgi:hypothetical protein
MIGNELNDFLQYSSHKVTVIIYDVQAKDPLNLVALSFNTNKKNVVLKSARDLARALKMLNSYSLQKKRQNIYVRNQYTYYDNNTIYLVKPNQKRFWTRSQAIDDATSLIIEINNMKDKK